MIHYHGTRFSGPQENMLELAGKHAMVSWEDPSHVTLIAEICSTFCLDNGAFSAWKQGKQMNFTAYQHWAEQWLRHPGCDFAMIPDVIDGTAADNDSMLSDWPVDGTAVPVWHLHESIGRLVRLCSDYPKVALGSSGEYAEIGTQAWWHRMAEAMDEIVDGEGFPIAKLHGLRMLDPGIFSYIPFASADSTNVARNIGLDVRWTGPYVPSSQRVRAAVIMDRIETHACAARWTKSFCIKQPNLFLLG